MHEPFFHLLEAMAALLSKERVLVVNFGVSRGNLTQDSAQTSPSHLARIVPGAEEAQSPLAMQHHFQIIDRPAVSLGAQEPARHDASAAIVKGFDELTLVTCTSSDEDWFELESPPRSPHRQSPSLLHSSSLPRDNPSHETSLRQDPYSALSSLQREVMLQIQNNGPFFPEGVPIRAVFRRTISPRSGVNESDIR